MGKWILVVALAAAVGCADDSGQPEGAGGGASVGGGGDGGSGSDGCSCEDAESPLTVECLCTLLGCPSFEEAVVMHDCPGNQPDPHRLGTGCGQIDVISRNRGGSSFWVFDEETHELAAAYRMDDSPWGPCRISHYVTDTFEPTAACADVTECSLCSDDADACALP